jgi:hypothetical protein
MRADVKYSKQSTFGNIPEAKKCDSPTEVPVELRKHIQITNITTSTKEDKLVFKVGFKMLPSKTAFSRLTADVYFDEHKIDCLRFRIIQGPLATDYSEFSFVIDMTGIAKGQHCLRIELYELWSATEKLTCASKEITVQYVPVRREERLIKVPIMKTIAGADLVVVSDSEKNLHREIDENMKKETISKRDEW